MAVKTASFTDTVAVDTFVNSTGTFSAGQINYSTTYNPTVNGVSTDWTTGSWDIDAATYTLSLTGKDGTLYATTGTYAGMGGSASYVYVPNADAINALSATDTDMFVITARRMQMGGSSTRLAAKYL